MSKFLAKFSWQTVTLTRETMIVLIVVWLALLATAVSSILSQCSTKKQRLFWLSVVIFVPVLGLLAYLPFSCSDSRFRLPMSQSKKP